MGRSRRPQKPRRSRLVKPLPKTASCPKCGIGLDEKTYENIPLMKCPDCKGVWFEGDALKQLLQIALRPQTNLFFNI